MWIPIMLLPEWEINGSSLFIMTYTQNLINFGVEWKQKGGETLCKLESVEISWDYTGIGGYCWTANMPWAVLGGAKS